MTRKKKQERLFEEIDPSELEALTKELGERVGELVAIVKLAKVSFSMEESARQIARLGIRSHELSDRVKGYADRLNLAETQEAKS